MLPFGRKRRFCTGPGLLKQLLISLVVLIVAAAGFVFLVPGASQMLANIGITLPGSQVEANAPQNASGQPGGQRPGGQRGGNRTLVVVTAPVGTATINDRLNAIGVGAALRSVNVASVSGGTLTAILTRPGDQVAANAVIATLDSESETIAVDRAALALKDASETLRRTTELANSNAATTVQLNTAQLAVDNAQLELQAAELALKRRSIVTPIAGTVGLFQVSEGNYVNAQTLVTTIEDTSEIRISFWVPERYASVLATGMEVSAEAIALPGEVFTGVVTAIDNRVDTASRTLQVEARIPNTENRMRAGMSFAVSMAFEGESFASVDPLAIQWSGEGAYVWAFSEGTVRKAMVRIIQRNSDGVLVEGEVKPGDAVVTQGVQQLSDGAAVRLLDAPAEPSGQQGQRPKPAAPQS